MFEIVTDKALEKLNALSAGASLIKGAVAYWTFPAEKIDAAFFRGLAAPESFLCCDIHSPTSVDALESFHRNGSRIFLHLYQLVGRTELPDSKGIPDHLMHSKILIFEDGSDECWVWIGSHNGTARALLGINFECSIVFKTSKTSSVYFDINEHLNVIKSKSTRFDSKDKDYYRMLQGLANADAFIEVVDHHESELKPATELTIFGSHIEDHRQLKSVGKKVYLAVTSAISNKETIYESSITQSGELKANAITFKARRFAFRETRALPELQKNENVPRSVYQKAKFFVTLKVGKPLFGVEAIETPPELWEDIHIESYLDERNVSSRITDGSPHRLATRAKVKIQRARVREDEFKNESARVAWDRAFTVLALEDKISMADHPLVRRRIIKELDAPDRPPFQEFRDDKQIDN